VPIQVGLRGVAARKHGPEAVAEAMHGERARWRRAADRNLIVLGTLGNKRAISSACSAPCSA